MEPVMLNRNLLIVAGAGLGLYAVTTGLIPRLGRKLAKPPRMATDPVRDSGPDEMRDKPASWDMVDERSDESFPASDPPGTY
jgi:hypothetical protein